MKRTDIKQLLKEKKVLDRTKQIRNSDLTLTGTCLTSQVGSPPNRFPKPLLPLKTLRSHGSFKKKKSYKSLSACPWDSILADLDKTLVS